MKSTNSSTSDLLQLSQRSGRKKIGNRGKGNVTLTLRAKSAVKSIKDILPPFLFYKKREKKHIEKNTKF